MGPRVLIKGIWYNSSVTSVIGPESLLVATFACVGFSRENHRPGFRDFCNTIGQNRTHAVQQNTAYSITSSAATSKVCGTVSPERLSGPAW
jgi:hypothetical protein